MADPSATVLPLQAPKDVSVADIEKELNKVWSSKGESVAARAATFNLVVFEAQDRSFLEPSASVESIATQNPCRVIDLRSKPEGDPNEGVEAQVAAYCPIQRDRSNLICCEYITLQAPESAFLRMCSTVDALLIHDLPTFLWWQGDLDLNSELFQKLVSQVDRIIVDSRHFINPEEDLGEMHQLIKAGHFCSDLNWQRLGSWQELTAQAFDPPDRREALNWIDRATLDYKAPNPCQAYLCLGWLASRLDWNPVERTQALEHDYLIDRILFTTPRETSIKAELASVPVATETTEVGDLIGLRLNSSDTQVDACTVLCSETTGCMRMETMGGAQSCSIRQVSAIDNPSVDVLLEKQLHRLGPDRLYEESLEMTLKILETKR